MEVACPQCGNPNLDVDEGNSVVYCKNCGFAVKVDPQSGNVTPLSEGGGAGQMPSGESEGYGRKTILWTDPLTFFLGGTAVLLLALYVSLIPMSYFMLLESAVILLWWYGR